MLWLAVAPGDLHAVADALARDPAELYRFVTERVGALPVQSVATSLVLRRVKQAGTRMDGPRLTDPEPLPARR